MSDLEGRLRAELRAESQRTQPQQLRELQVPARRRGGARRWLAPAAALAAVAVVATVIGVVAGGRLDPGPVRGSPSASASASASPGRPQPSPSLAPSAPSPTTPAAAAMPPFYVTYAAGGDAAHPAAIVRDSASGAVRGQVSLPGQYIGYVAAAGDDRTFVLAAYRSAAGGTVDSGSGTSFYRLTLTASGRPEPLARLPLTVQPGAHLDAAGPMALSADGATLAVSVIPTAADNGQPGTGSAMIEVVSLRTGAVRTWTAPSSADLQGLSWGTGTSLAFLTRSLLQQSGPGGGYQLRILDTAGRGGSLMGSSQPVALGAAEGPVLSAVLADGGRILVAWTRPPAPAGQAGNVVLAAFSVPAGRRLRVLDTLPSRGQFDANATVWAADPAGEHVLIGGTEVTGLVTPTGGGSQQPEEEQVFGRIDNGRFTSLPDPVPAEPQAASW